jgi:hypothetical protein
MPTESNVTDEVCFIDPAAHARFPVMICVYLPAFFISEIGNGFVIYSLAYLKRLKRTVIDNYILNLAVADFIITTISLFNAFEYVKNQWMLGEVMCKIHGQAMETCYTASTFTLLVISYNRRNVVNDRFKKLDEKKNIRRDIILIWLAAIVLTSPLAYAYTVAKRNGRFHCSNTNFSKTFRSGYYLFQAVILFFVPVTIMIVTQRTISKGLRRHSQIYRSRVDCKNDHFKRVITRESKVTKLLTWIWVVFVCCFTPHITLRTIDHFISIRVNELLNQVWHVSQLLALLNSAINPFLYYRATKRDGDNVSNIVKLLCCIPQFEKWV